MIGPIRRGSILRLGDFRWLVNARLDDGFEVHAMYKTHHFGMSVMSDTELEEMARYIEKHAWITPP